MVTMLLPHAMKLTLLIMVAAVTDGQVNGHETSSGKQRNARETPDFSSLFSSSNFGQNLSPDKFTEMANPSQFASMIPGGSGSSGSSSASESSAAASEVKYRIARQLPSQFTQFPGASNIQSFSPDKFTEMANPSQFASMIPGGGGSSGSSSASETSAAASDVKYRIARQLPSQFTQFPGASNIQSFSPDKFTEMANPSQFASMIPGGGGSSGSSSASETSAAASDVKYRIARQLPSQFTQFPGASNIQSFSPDKFTEMANPSQFASMIPGGGGSSGSSSASETSAAASDVKYRIARQLPSQFTQFPGASNIQSFSPDKFTEMANPSQFASMIPGGGGSSGSSSASETSAAASDVKYRIARQLPSQFTQFPGASNIQSFSPDKFTEMANPSQFASMIPGGGGSSGSSSASETSAAASDVKYRIARQLPSQFTQFPGASNIQSFSPDKFTEMANPSQFASMIPGGGGSSGSSSASETSAAASDVKYRIARQLPSQFTQFPGASNIQSFSPDKFTEMANPSQFASMIPGGGGSSGSSSASETSAAASDVKYRIARQLPSQFTQFPGASNIQSFSPDKFTEMANPSQFASMIPGGGGSSGSSSASETSAAASDVKYRIARQLPSQFTQFPGASNIQSFSPDKFTEMANPSQFASMIPGGGGSSGSSSASETSAAASDVKYRIARQLPSQFTQFPGASNIQSFSPDKFTEMANPSQFASMIPGGGGSSGSSSASETSAAASDVKYRIARQLPSQFTQFPGASNIQSFSPDKFTEMANPNQFASMIPGGGGSSSSSSASATENSS